MGKPFGESLQLPQVATPASNPPSGFYLMYFKSDGKLYIKDSSGTESVVSTGGGGGAVLVPESPTQPASDGGDGSLWYDTDSNEGAGTDVEFIQATQPDASASPDGILWFDTDDPGTDALVPTTRQVQTSVGLTGGGALSADLTLAVDFAPDGVSSSTEAVRADDSRINGTVSTSRLGTGTADATTYLRGDQTWATVQSGGAEPLAQSNKGTWDPVATYVKGDIVAFQGKTYVANQDIATPQGYVMPTPSGKSFDITYSTAHTITIPATAQVGDLMVMSASQYSTSTTPTISGPAWTQITNGSASGTYVTYYWAYMRTVQSGEPGTNITVTFGQSYSSVDLRTFSNATFGSAAFQGTNSSGTGSTPAIAMALPGIAVHMYASMSYPNSGTITLDSHLTDQQSGAQTNYFVAGSGDETYSTAGTAAGRTVTLGGASSGICAAVATVLAAQPQPDATKWDLLPFGSALPSGSWELIAQVSPSGTTNTIGNLRFSGIPSGYYSQFRIVTQSLATTSTTNTNMNLYLLFNGDQTGSYGSWMEYHSTGTMSATTSSGAAYGYAIYNYFYTGTSYGKTWMDCTIYNDGVGPIRYESRGETSMNSANTAYGYGSVVRGAFSKSDPITQIDLYASGSYTWDSSSVVYLYGMRA